MMKSPLAEQSFRPGRSAACNVKNEYLRRQREILKKAMSILSEEPQSGLR